MANKQYISIIRLFNYCEISTGKDFDLSRAKKQMQAEFSIAKNGFIEVEGYSYSRHDVFEELEHPDFLKRLEFHKGIWNAKPLLELLENNLINFSIINEGFRGFWDNPSFDEFFSPYFAGPFKYLSRNLLSEPSLAEAGQLLHFSDFLRPAEREESFSSLRIFLDENLKLLRNTTLENYRTMRPKLIHWIEQDWHIFFNNLPQELYDIRDNLVVHLINLGVALQKKHRNDCRKMSDKLVLLQDLPENVRQTISSNHLVYHGSSSYNFRGGFWIVLVIVGLIRAMAGGCQNNSNDYRFQNNNFYKYQIDSINRYRLDTNSQRIIDSLIKSLPHSK